MALEQGQSDLASLTRAGWIISIRESGQLALKVAHELENGNGANQQPEILAALSTAEVVLRAARERIAESGSVILNRPAQVIEQTQAQVVREESSDEDLTNPKTFSGLLSQEIKELLPTAEPLWSEDVKSIFGKLKSAKIDLLNGTLVRQEVEAIVYKALTTPGPRYKNDPERLFSKRDIHRSFLQPNYQINIIDKLSGKIGFKWEEGKDETKVNEETAFAVKGLVRLYEITQNKENGASRD